MMDSMLEKIYGSTLFKASKNQDAIRSALENPVNMELVQQLREYLDDDVRRKLVEKPVEFDTEGMFSEDVVDDDNESDEEDSREPSAGAPRVSPASFSSKSDHLDDLKEFEDAGDTPSSVEDDNSTEDTKPQPAENDSSVESATMIQPKLDLNALQGTLNSREDTAGVSYLLQKDNELWIHYNDSINLNNTMEAVITLIRDLGYDNLTFNRLARSANAIVFEIVMTTVNNYSMSSKEEN